MAIPLMPKATAVWLVENTSLTFEQIAQFCDVHILEIQAIADGDIAGGMVGFDPITNGQLTLEEIERCTADPTAHLTLSAIMQVGRENQRKGHYVSVALRQDRPNGIAWLVKSYPDMSDLSICRLVGTTKPMIGSIRLKTHKNIANIKPNHPVTLGLCSQKELDEAIAKIK